MKKPLTPANALERLETLCSGSEQSTFDVRRRLRLWGVNAADAERIVESLHRDRYVDDARYARAFVHDKYLFNRWGRAKIKVGLIARRVDARLINEALEQIDEEIYSRNLRDILRSKIASMGSDAATYDGRTKLFRYGASRGFEPSMVIDAIRDRNLWTEEEQQD